MFATLRRHICLNILRKTMVEPFDEGPSSSSASSKARKLEHRIPTLELEAGFSVCVGRAMDDAVSCASEQIQGKPSALPWETGIAGDVFGQDKSPLKTFWDEPMKVGRRDFLMGACFNDCEAKTGPILPTLPFSKRRLKLMSWYQEPDDLKARALGMVRIMIGSDFSATQIGAVLHSMSSDLNKEGDIRRSLADVFAAKSPATLYKRTRSFWRFFQWKAKGNYSEGLRMSESAVYD